MEENKKDLNFIKDKIISIEDIFKDESKVFLDGRKLELFLNGVKLKTSEKDGIYRVYVSDNFIGLGEIKRGLLKRDVIL